MLSQCTHTLIEVLKELYGGMLSLDGLNYVNTIVVLFYT